MTVKGFRHFQTWLESDKRNKIAGYIYLFPQAIKFIEKPSNYLVNWSEKGEPLFISANHAPENIQLVGEYFRIKFQDGSKPAWVHFKHVQHIRLYKYNY